MGVGRGSASGASTRKRYVPHAADYTGTLGARLRAVRVQQGLSLQRVEQRSNGRWKAVVIGAYERGERRISVVRLVELAAFYRVPPAELLVDPRRATSAPGGHLVLDLERLAGLPREHIGPLARWVAHVQRLRGDYNNRVLSVRRTDLPALAVLYDASVGAFADQLAGWGVLAAPARGDGPDLGDGR